MTIDMSLIAFVNCVIQGIVITLALRLNNQRQRRTVATLAGAALACSAVGLLWRTLGDAAMANVASWTLYGAIGVAVVAGMASALRQPGAMRFAWRQGRYAKYRSYRRI